MGTNILHPEEWIEISAAIAAGDDVGHRLAERERRFDNYFQDLTDFYTPTMGQSNFTINDGPISTVTLSASRVRGLRVGSWIMMTVSMTASSTLAFGANASGITVVLPKELAMDSAESSTFGSFAFYDQSATTWYTGASFPGGGSGYTNIDEVYGAAGRTSAGADIGRAIDLTTSDQVSVSVAYKTMRSKSLA